MRKKFLLMLILILSVSMFVPIISSAKTNEITVSIDGEIIDFDVEPQIINGRTMVPMRAIFEKLGATVEWDKETETITSNRAYEYLGFITEKEIVLQIDNPTMHVKGTEYDIYENEEFQFEDEEYSFEEDVTLDTPAFIVDGRTLVPLRAISEAFDLYVGWDDDTNTVIISTLNAGVPSISRESYDAFASTIKRWDAERRMYSIDTIHYDSYYSCHKIVENIEEYIEEYIKNFEEYIENDNGVLETFEYRLYDDRIEIGYNIYKSKYGYDIEEVYFTYYNDLTRSADVILEKDDTSIEAYYVYGIDGYEVTAISDASAKDITDVFLNDAIEEVKNDAGTIGTMYPELFRLK